MHVYELFRRLQAPTHPHTYTHNTFYIVIQTHHTSHITHTPTHIHYTNIALAWPKGQVTLPLNFFATDSVELIMLLTYAVSLTATSLNHTRQQNLSILLTISRPSISPPHKEKKRSESITHTDTHNTHTRTHAHAHTHNIQVTKRELHIIMSLYRWEVLAYTKTMSYSVQKCRKYYKLVPTLLCNIWCKPCQGKGRVSDIAAFRHWLINKIGTRS